MTNAPLNINVNLIVTLTRGSDDAKIGRIGRCTLDRAERRGYEQLMDVDLTPASFSRRTIIAASGLLKALGHSGLDQFLLEMEVPDLGVGRSEGLKARTVALAKFAVENVGQLSPERSTVAYEIVLRAIEIWRSEITTNLQSDDRDKFAAALKAEGQGASLSIETKEVLTLGGEVDEFGMTDMSIKLSGQSLDALRKAVKPDPSPASAPPVAREVFVVHGHDGDALHAVARYVEKLEFKATILHEQPNRGRTIIEKFEAYSGVGFVIVLLTPDDVGGKVGEESHPRARQNVLLEWGFFIGKVGRSRVLALKKGVLELPSDILGIAWQELDDHGGWKIKLAQELQAAGYEIDWTKVSS